MYDEKLNIKMYVDKLYNDSYGQMSLIVASRAINDTDCLKYLLSNGYDINIRTGVGLDTALTIAINKNKIEFVKLLTINGADLTLKRSNGDNTFMHAYESGRFEILNWLQNSYINNILLSSMYNINIDKITSMKYIIPVYIEQYYDHNITQFSSL